MPPKGKKEKLKKKKKSIEEHEALESSEREIALRAKLENKVKQLAEIKMRVHTTEQENNWLTKEADRLQIEMREYTHFMSKKANLRQTQMITLGDYHRQEIEDINRDIKNMTKEHKQKKKEYQLELIRKSQLLLEAKHELKTMDGYRIIREQQSDEIKRLEEEIKLIRSKHVHEIAHMKSTYDKEIRHQRRSTDIKIAEIQRRANQDVEETLHVRIISIAKENAELEDKIENIIQRKQKLHQLKQHLEDEQIHLIRHLKFVTDLRKINLNTASFNITNNSYKSIQY